MENMLSNAIAFIVGAVVGAGAAYLVLRNNPRIVEQLKESLDKARAEEAKYREKYEELIAKIKLKVNGE